jgi:hypothetical protein
MKKTPQSNPVAIAEIISSFHSRENMGITPV